MNELRALIRLAIPLVIARAGAGVTGAVDTLIAGRVSSDALAAVGLGSACWFLVFILPFGIALGLDPLVSQAVGARRPDDWKQGLVATRWLSLMLSVPAMVLVYFSPDILLATGQPAEVVEVLRPYMAITSFALLPTLFFHTYAIYLTAHGHTRQFVLITVAVNVLNLVLNIWFVNGGFGVPALGVVGIGASSLGCAIVEYGLLRWTVSRFGKLTDLQVPWTLPDRAYLGRVLRTGLPVGIQYGLEMAGFSLATFLMGHFGAAALAGHQIAISLAGLTFTVALGVGAAGSVRVGHARGAGDIEGVKRAGWTALAVGTCWALFTAILIGGGREWVARFYTTDPETLRIGVAFLTIAAVFQFADIVQAIGFGVLRGLNDTRVPMVFNVVAYWCVGVPIGVTGAFVWFDDPRALWWGLTLSLFSVATALVWRFHALTEQLESLPQAHRDPA